MKDVAVDTVTQPPLLVGDDAHLPSEPTKKNKHYLAALMIFILGLGTAVGIVYLQSVSDYAVLKNADPTIVALAQQAGMSRKGELVFLRAKPQLVSDDQMRSDCADNAAANNKNGFIEQGCFVPNARNHATGRIFIRKMPPNLYDQEIVTATYEMLHSVYFSVSASRQASALVQAIENNYNTVHNPALDSQIVNFAKTEPGYRDLELFSLLGTEYAKLSPDIESFYAPYFVSRTLTVDSYGRVSAIFQNEQNQLNQLRLTRASDEGKANTAYADSLAWAKQGNAYEDTYNYNIYKNYIAQENAIIDQYNQLSQEYNTLVTEYNGSQPVNSIQNIQTQASK